MLVIGLFLIMYLSPKLILTNEWVQQQIFSVSEARADAGM